MKKLTVLLWCLACLTIIGCVTLPTADQLTQADYGPFPQNWKSDIANYLRSTLKDPDSAETTVDKDNAKPKKYCYGHGGLFGNTQYGWCNAIQVNAKNSYGAYMGYKDMIFCWSNGAMDSTVGDYKEFFITPDGNRTNRLQAIATAKFNAAEAKFIFGN